MKATGIVRQMDQLGRVVIPMELRRTFDIQVQDSIEVFTSGEHIILKKYRPGCALCDNVDNLINLEGKRVCRSCLAKLNIEDASQR